MTTENNNTQTQLGSRYVSADKLLDVLFDAESKPSLRWLRDQQAARAIPFVKIGRLVFFDPTAVKASLESRRTYAPRGRGPIMGGAQ